MFKKIALVGILLVTLLILSGCGAYTDPCQEDENNKCYGKLTVPMLGSSECKAVGLKTIGNLCFAIGDQERCNQLLTTGKDGAKMVWTSLYVPKYETNLCVETCTLSSSGSIIKKTCGSGAECMYLPDFLNRKAPGGEGEGYDELEDGSFVTYYYGICSPTCTSDAKCLPGLTSCQSGKCLPVTDIKTEFTLGTPEMTVELVPKDVPANGPVLGQSYDFDIYITSNYGQTISGNLQLVLKTKQNVLVTTTAKAATSGPFAGKTLSHNGDFYWLQFGSTVLFINPGQRYLLGTLALQAKSTGPFGIDLDTANTNTKIEYSSGKKYTLKPVTSSTYCVPKTAAQCPDPSSSCGYIDDACGGFVKCNGICESNYACVDNACVPAVDQLDLPSDDEKLVLKTIFNALQDKDADGNLLSLCKTDPPATDPPAPELCELAKLNAIIQAVKTWFKS